MAKTSAPKRKSVAKKGRPAKKSTAATRKRPAVKVAQKKKAAAKKAKPAKRSRPVKAAPKNQAKARKAKPATRVAPTKAKARPVLRVAMKAAKKPAARTARRVVKTSAVNRAGDRRAPAKRAPIITVAAKKASPAKPIIAAKAMPVPKPASVKARVRAPAAPARRAPALDRDRRVMRESDLPPSPPSSLVPQRHASAASSGADELRVKLANHTGTGPALTAGDLDADWQAAETVGDEAPGGDNPTPDQDVVEDIGRALGVQYDDDEELQGGDEIAARDHDRWELDPASSDDFDER